MSFTRGKPIIPVGLYWQIFMYPLTQLNTHLYLNTFLKKVTKFNWLECYHHKRFYKESTEMCLELIPYIHLHQHQSCEHQHRAP